MYFSGEIVITLAGTVIEMRPPTNFFGGVANLLTRGSWGTPEARETYKLMALVQAAYRGLMEAGVRDAIRIAVGDTVIYEDRKGNPDDFGIAMTALRSTMDRALEHRPRAEFDLILAHDDGVLHYVIDLDFLREHKPGVHPLTIRVTATSAELRLHGGESATAYANRIRKMLADQASFDAFRARLEERFGQFLTAVKDGLAPAIGAQHIAVRRETRFVSGGGGRSESISRDESAEAWRPQTALGRPFYGFDPVGDLFCLAVWTSILTDQGLHSNRFVYVDPQGQHLAQADSVYWYGSDFAQFDASHHGGGGGSIDAGSGRQGGGGSIDAGSSHHGGGGWLDSISSAFSGGGDGHGGGDHGGGGDVGGGDGGGGSSCSGCGGGGGCGSA